jgi:hypothetical protein
LLHMIGDGGGVGVFVGERVGGVGGGVGGIQGVDVQTREVSKLQPLEAPTQEKLAISATLQTCELGWQICVACGKGTALWQP